MGTAYWPEGELAEINALLLPVRPSADVSGRRLHDAGCRSVCRHELIVGDMEWALGDAGRAFHRLPPPICFDPEEVREDGCRARAVGALAAVGRNKRRFMPGYNERGPVRTLWGDGQCRVRPLKPQ